MAFLVRRGAWIISVRKNNKAQKIVCRLRAARGLYMEAKLRDNPAGKGSAEGKRGQGQESDRKRRPGGPARCFPFAFVPHRWDWSMINKFTGET